MPSATLLVVIALAVMSLLTMLLVSASFEYAIAADALMSVIVPSATFALVIALLATVGLG